jgi:hypothetical protein
MAWAPAAQATTGVDAWPPKPYLIEMAAAAALHIIMGMSSGDTRGSSS